MRCFTSRKGPGQARRICVLGVLSLGFLGTGCGRVGIELLPLDLADVPPVTGGRMDASEPGDPGDGGPSETDSGDDGDSSVQDGGEPTDAGGGGDQDGGSEQDAGCPTPCQNANGSASCASGSCQLSCALGYADCDGVAGNGCEASTADTAMTCGGCALSCENPHGGTACAGGLCSSTCDASFGDCDSNSSNGCETDLRSVSSCGACGVSCSNAHGSTSCPAASCTPVCAAGYADCDGNRTNGCETDVQNDPAHCGSCPRACGSNGQICVAGQCQASPCVAGRGECDGDLGMTCETDLTSSLGNCGFCGNTCSTANGTPRCASSSCGVASCNGGFGNCDGSASNGCETPFATTTAHCGACGAACNNAHWTTSCASSSCVPNCSTGFGDCDSSRPNGCETALNTVSNCGVCGRTCAGATGGTPICNAGVCGVTCSLSGTYALRMNMTGSWQDDGQVQGGSGTFNFWMRVQATHSGNNLSITLTECGRFIPDFRTTIVNELINYGYPNSLFDGNFLPSTSTSVTLGSSSPGASFTMPRSAVQMGVNMADPINGAWPGSASGIASGIRIDHDGDGKAGVTAVYSNTGGHSHPRTSTSPFGFNRADNPYVASRVSFALSGSMTSCTQGSGTANFAFVDTRIFGCSRSGSTTDCTGSEASFLDGNCLIYTLGSATYSLLKVADGASCSTIRSSL